ncbi:molybdopterin-guanine dinucleotide biosynthesis protein B [Paenibacillus sp. GCM10023252]|uniref:molybdopterin-guanine dinucleotide biosynthesis protein B n=1 Tax=Paenibacillus sp. GCM10023252 TaxID=3252649 RepID=UPI003618449A
MLHHKSPLIVQVVGYKNTGKTTMVCRLTERFKQSGYSVGTIKHDAHSFTMDKPGSDTWQHQQSGADVTAITSSTRAAILSSSPIPLQELIQQMAGMDLILIEGFKNADYPKIIMLKEAADIELLTTLSRPLLGAAWPEYRLTQPESTIPIIDLNDIQQAAELIKNLPAT